MAEAPRYFKNPAAMQHWFATHAGTAKELIVGFMKKATRVPSVTWPEAVDEALCVGWIDGIRRRIDEERYTIRFTPRRPGSQWSAVNIARVAVLTAEGRMQPAGLAVFAARTDQLSRRASYEQAGPVVLGDTEATRLRAIPGAWDFFSRQPPGYRKRVVWWVMSAKRPETRVARASKLAEACASAQRL